MSTTRRVVENGADQVVNRDTMVYEQIRDFIVNGRLAPGTRIIETDVARRLDVSRTPVRSALQRLQHEGYIVTAGDGRQMRPSVAPLTQEDAWELFGIVGVIEGFASRQAAALEPGSRAELVEALRTINQRLLDAIEPEELDRDLLFDLDTEFHQSYVQASAGPRLQMLHDAIKPQAERYVRLYTSALWGEVGVSVQEHELIIDAIAAGDEDGAQRTVQENWRNAALRLNQVIDTVGERGSW